MGAFRDGMEQPWAQHIAAAEGVDRAFCQIVADASPSEVAFPMLCDLVPALVGFEATDPGWIKRMTRAADAVHKMLSQQKVYGSNKWDIGLSEERRRRPEEVRVLKEWSEAQLKAAPTKHHHFL
jgi:hypothetical protein